jgi:hypothetical protein
MDQTRISAMALSVRHQHSDGSWASLEPSSAPAHHSPVEHDPERHWPEGQLYACTTCDERVVVAHADLNAPDPHH